MQQLFRPSEPCEAPTRQPATLILQIVRLPSDIILHMHAASIIKPVPCRSDRSRSWTSQSVLMYRASSGKQLRPMHKALIDGPKQPHFRKDRRPKRHGVFDKTPPRHRPESQPSRSSTPPQLRNQILRVATEAFGDIEVEEASPQNSPMPPSPCTPPFPPPHPDDHEEQEPEQLQDDHRPTIQDVMDMVTTVQRALIDSHGKLGSLFQKTSTVLATQHEAMTALISCCKQQLHIVESLVRQGTPDWS